MTVHCTASFVYLAKTPLSKWTIWTSPLGNARSFRPDFNLTSDILVNTFHQIQTQTNLRLARLQLEYAGRSYSIPSAFDLGLRAEIDGKSGNGHLQCVFDVDQKPLAGC